MCIFRSSLLFGLPALAQQTRSERLSLFYSCATLPVTFISLALLFFSCLLSPSFPFSFSSRSRTHPLVILILSQTIYHLALSSYEQTRRPSLHAHRTSSIFVGESTYFGAGSPPTSMADAAPHATTHAMPRTSACDRRSIPIPIRTTPGVGRAASAIGIGDRFAARATGPLRRRPTPTPNPPCATPRARRATAPPSGSRNSIPTPSSPNSNPTPPPNPLQPAEAQRHHPKQTARCTATASGRWCRRSAARRRTRRSSLSRTPRHRRRMATLRTTSSGGPTRWTTTSGSSTRTCHDREHWVARDEHERVCVRPHQCRRGECRGVERVQGGEEGERAYGVAPADTGDDRPGRTLGLYGGRCRRERAAESGGEAEFGGGGDDWRDGRGWGGAGFAPRASGEVGGPGEKGPIFIIGIVHVYPILVYVVYLPMYALYPTANLNPILIGFL
ncbi:hypothetical protein K438DRAFT_362679 [Mycena galopus ATCC 62051]|nr:hypothetical protein K438DRAFT_362679 [Mycena galopus ATCC 62051]